MRYIDTSSVSVPSNWIELAKQEGFTTLWSYFKIELEKIVGKKCWYSETTNAGANNHIDHFRPKAIQVKELTQNYATLSDFVWNQLDTRSRAGYPFLEFEFSNYRYSSDYVNSPHSKGSTGGVTRGKSNFFPLKKSSPFAKNLNEVLANVESIALLDPCNENDPKKLMFNELGLVFPAIGILDNTWEYCQVKVSIEIYHLEYSWLVENRKIKWNDSKRSILLLKNLFKKILQENKEALTECEQESFVYHSQFLINNVKKSSQFSAVVIDCIRYYRDKEDCFWLSQIIPNVELDK